MKNKVISEALKWVGYLEKKSNSQLEHFTANAGSNNYTIFAKWYHELWGSNYQAQPWCAVWVSCVFQMALGSDVQSRIMPHFSYCPYGVSQFKKMGGWVTANPQIGDVIFFKDSSGVSVHVGIVYSVDKDRVYTVEGNTSSAAGVVANGGAVAKKSYALGYSRILGYGRAKYMEQNKYSYDNTVDNMIKDGITTVENMTYWEKVLDGREPMNREYVRVVLDRYSERVRG